MKINALRPIACCLTATWVATSTVAPAFAADRSYPNRPLRIIVSTTPGGGPDIMARLIGQRLAETLGQQAVIDNRAGASGIIGTELASQAAPDGYTLLLATGQNSIVQGMYEGRLKYHLARDFAPIILIATTPFLLVVNPSVAAHSVEQLIALAKAKPGVLRYGSAGAGSPPHLSAEVFRSMTGTDLQHIPYKGVVPALNDVLAGHIELAFSAIAAALPFVKSERLRALGISSAKRSAILPDLPAIGETVPGYEFVGWYGLMAPAKTPGAIIARINAELARAFNTPEFQARISDLGADPAGGTPGEFRTFMLAHMEKMRKAVVASGARPE
jgi:tripartite-type tricarboxylate transporter receptor subunit TctC